MLFLLSLKMFQMIKNTLCYIPAARQNIPLAKFLIAPIREKALPFNVISKSMNFQFAQKEDFWRKTD